MINFFIFLIIIAISLSFISFIKGKDLVNKVVAFDTISVISISLLVLLSITQKEVYYLDIAFVFALIGFVGIIIFARFNQIDKKENLDD